MDINELVNGAPQTHKQDIVTDAPQDAELALWKAFLDNKGYDWLNKGEGSLQLAFMNQKMLQEFKKRFMEWYKNHPDVWNEDQTRTPHIWFVLNLIGDLIMWRENPWEWIRKPK